MTDDGLGLAAWVVPRPGAPAVVLLHGYPADRADMLPIAAGLASRFTVFLLDQRYFGRSEGRLTTLGFKERRDLGRALDFLATRGVGAVGVFGFSLGGAVALLAAAEDPRIRAVAAYAPFADLRLLGHELYAWLGPLKYPLVGMTRVWSRLFVGDDITRPAPVEAAATLTVPVLLVASRADEQIPFAHAERLREALAANPRAEFVFTAGGGSGIRDDEYAADGAALAAADEVWQRAELVLKVKEPLPAESARLRPGQILFTYLHLAPAPELARALGDSGAIAIAYETVQRADGSLPLLTPMSEVAGRLAVQEGAFYLGRPHGGRGVLLSRVPGVPPRHRLLLGAATAGLNAARTAVGLGADVSILDVTPDRLRHVDDIFRGQAVTLMSNSFNVEQVLRRADLLVGAVLLAGARAPRLVTKEMVATMKEGSVIVDVSVDQGGCVETIHPTTLLDPVYLVSGVVHYGVANMPALVPRTSTFALTNAMLPYALELATRGVAAATRANPALAKGVNICRGQVVHPAVAEALGAPATPLDACLG